MHSVGKHVEIGASENDTQTGQVFLVFYDSCVAAGEWRSELTTSIPTSQLPEGTSFKAGDNVRLSNGANAVVKEVTSDALTLDFNPPMAGKALTFEVELVKLTKVLQTPYSEQTMQ